MAESQSQNKECGLQKPPETSVNLVLSVSPNHEDCASLEGILDSQWTVIEGSTIASALSALREIPIPIVIYDCDVSSG